MGWILRGNYGYEHREKSPVKQNAPVGEVFLDNFCLTSTEPQANRAALTCNEAITGVQLPALYVLYELSLVNVLDIS